MAIDRRSQVETSSTVVGIDFVEVDPTTQTTLTVYFIGSPDGSGKFGTIVDEADWDGEVRIESASSSSTVPTVEVTSAKWSVDGTTCTLVITTETPGDFSYYTLTLVDSATTSRIDPYYNGVSFRFQAGCRSDLDCAEAGETCDAVTEPDVPIDYTARDYGSFRRALLEFASLRWPEWKDRLEADVGIMLLELMSALGDELAYGQDRIARESSLRTATQRRSLRQHARLLDYEVQDGLTAWTWIRAAVTADYTLTAGTQVRTPASVSPETGEVVGEQIIFEIGRGLMDQPADGTPFTSWTLHAEWNEIQTQIWDEDDTCLPAGSTSIDVLGQWKTVAPTLSEAGDQWVLIQTSPDTPPVATAYDERDDEISSAVLGRALVVRLTGLEEIWDPLMNGGTGGWVTRLSWEDEEATPWPMNLSYARVCANLAPAMAGRTVPGADDSALVFSIGEVPDPAPDGTVRAIERTGPDGSVCYLLPLDETEDDLLCFVGESADAAFADVQVFEVDGSGNYLAPWEWRRSLVGSPSAQPEDEVYTLDDGLWGTVARYWRGGEEITHRDYRTGAGFTVRFGDGSLGDVPTEQKLFKVVYRVGCGASYNVGANVLTEVDDATNLTVTNPLAVTTGVDPQTTEEIRQLAPEAWQAVAWRAVRPEDYAEALERLDWVQKGGASLRWTGSWLTLMASVDPADTSTISEERRLDAERQLDRFRQAGRETHLLDPVYAWLDLRVVVCVESSCYRGDVKARVLEALFDEGGFFDPDQFTFGDPLIRSALYAAIQAVPGVRAVESVKVRRRGWFGWRTLGSVLKVGVNEVIGLCNDPVHPERGTCSLRMEGGA